MVLNNLTYGWQGFAAAFIAILIGYFLGSIPFGLILTKLFGAGDLRAIGSGNIGATNVLRTGRKGLALATLLLDGGKGAVAVGIGNILGPDDAVYAGIAAFIGHIAPIWLRFRGGKGVATFLGLGLGLSFWMGLAACGVWLLTAVISRYSSLAALVMAAATPVLAALLFRAPPGQQLIFGPVTLALALTLVAGLLFWRHRENIQRLLAGTEPKIGAKTKG
ncbi:MAG: glycerol-3-phosphate 1-O-acyltransferase PlsY [Pseudomonadota bacterium]